MAIDKYKYYSIAAAASKIVGNHPGLVYIQKQSQVATKILDVGCGEGSRLDTLLPAGKAAWGVDIDPYAIKLAQKQYPWHHFQLYSGKQLPFRDGEFDLVYSAFVLEHTTDPKSFIDELVRVGKRVVILCPNFGAPNRRSPNSVDNPIKKLILGFINDFRQNSQLKFTKVTPQTNYDLIDADTTVEPYLLPLIRYFGSLGSKIEIYSSLWELEPASFNPRKFLITLLGKLGIFPFRHWGPQIFVSVKVRTVPQLKH